MPGQVLQGCGGAEIGQQRAVLAERGVCILSVSPGVTAYNRTLAGAQPSDRGSLQLPCRQQIAVLVPPGTAGSGPVSFPTSSLHSALQCRFATAPGVLTRLRHPWPCSGAEVGPGTPPHAPGSLWSWIPLTLHFGFSVAPFCQATAEPFKGTWRRGESLPTVWCSLSSFQLCRAPSVVGQGRVTIFTTQLHDLRPRGIVWFLPTFTLAVHKLPGPPLTTRQCFLLRYVIDINSE